MPTVIPDGDNRITSAEVTAYGGAQQAKVAGTFGSTEQAVQERVEAKLAQLSSGWRDSGGSGGKQQAVAPEVLSRAAELQTTLADVVRQWAAPGDERALMEMFGVLTKAIVERDRLLLELRERLNASPY